MTLMSRKVLIGAMVMAVFLPALAREDETVEQLVARADSAPVRDRPALYSEAARRQADAADKDFAEGNVDQARAALHDVQDYCDRARDAALQSNKKLKDTEIAMRKLVHRLHDMNHTLAAEDQPNVQTVIDHLEGIRTQLLDRMFKKKGSS